MKNLNLGGIFFLAVTIILLLVAVAMGEEVTGLIVDQNGHVGIGDASPDLGLKLDVEGRVGATEYCDENGNNCVDVSSLNGGGNGGGISFSQAGAVGHFSCTNLQEANVRIVAPSEGSARAAILSFYRDVYNREGYGVSGGMDWMVELKNTANTVSYGWVFGFVNDDHDNNDEAISSDFAIVPINPDGYFRYRCRAGRGSAMTFRVVLIGYIY